MENWGNTFAHHWRVSRSTVVALVSVPRFCHGGLPDRALIRTFPVGEPSATLSPKFSREGRLGVYPEDVR